MRDGDLLPLPDRDDRSVLDPDLLDLLEVRDALRLVGRALLVLEQRVNLRVLVVVVEEPG